MFVLATGSDLDRLTAPIVPANLVALFVTTSGKTGWAIILGWRILASGPEPIFAGEPPRGAMFLRVDSETFIGTDNQRYEHIADIMVAVMQEEVSDKQ